MKLCGKRCALSRFVTVLLAFMLAFIAVTSVACDGGEKDPVTTGSSAKAKTTDEPATEAGTASQTPPAHDVFIFTDSCGRDVELPKTISKVAPTGGLSQQFLLSIAGDTLCCLSRYPGDEAAQYLDPDLMGLPEVGQFYGGKDLNMEVLADIHPDVVIDIGERKESQAEDMDEIQSRTGIPTIFIEVDLEKTGEAYRTLGRLLDKEAQGNALGDYCDRVYQDVREKMATIPEAERVRFAYLQGDNGLYAIAKDSFHAEVLDMVGTNVVEVDNPSSRGTGNEIYEEQLMLWDPDLILFAPGSVYPQVKEDPFFKTLRAIEHDNYFEVPGAPYNWIGMPPSVNRYMGMQWLSILFYPDVFDYDIKAVTQEYYKLFYGYEMNDDEFDRIMADAVR